MHQHPSVRTWAVVSGAANQSSERPPGRGKARDLRRHRVALLAFLELANELRDWGADATKRIAAIDGLPQFALRQVSVDLG